MLAAAWVTGSVSCAPLSDAEKSELLKKAADWEVPQPSEKARLVKIESGSRNGQDVCVLGFVEPGAVEKAMTGLDWHDLWRRGGGQGERPHDAREAWIAVRRLNNVEIADLMSKFSRRRSWSSAVNARPA